MVLLGFYPWLRRHPPSPGTWSGPKTRPRSSGKGGCTKRGNIKMISFLSLLGLLWNKGQMGTRKEGKKHHLFPSSPGAIRSLSRSFTFPKGLHFPLKHWHFVKKKTKQNKTGKKPQFKRLTSPPPPPPSKGIFRAFPTAPSLTPGKRKWEGNPRGRERKGPPKGGFSRSASDKKPLVFCHSFHFLAGSPSCQSPQENAL